MRRTSTAVAPARRRSVARMPRPIAILLAVYFAASVAHFTHNAEFIGFYPGMPAWLTREDVYLAWVAVTCVGAVALLMLRAGWRLAGLVFAGLYGAFGLDGLGHYTLALCSEHTLATNLTIWAEAVAGVLLLVASGLAAASRIEHRGQVPSL